MIVLDLFSGIGGFSLGFERAGMETIAFCEQDKYCQKVLKKHWPNIPIHMDVRGLDGTQYKGAVDVVCGGFPCQDLSAAGVQEGLEGERSSLYREMLRIVGECRPKFAVFENVAGLTTGEQGRWFAKFLYDLAEIGLDAQWFNIPASSVGAPHSRSRFWIVAYPNSDRKGYFRNGKASLDELGNSQKKEQERDKLKYGAICNPDISRELQKELELIFKQFELSEPMLCGTNDGVPGRLDRLKSLGNSVVPQIPEAIGKALMRFK